MWTILGPRTDPNGAARQRFDHPSAFRLLARYLKPDLLIIDDMGLKTLPARSGELLLEIILRRHEVRSTIMTSNRPVDEWGKLLGDVPAAGAILDRLLHRAEVSGIYLRGGSNNTAAPFPDNPSRNPKPRPKVQHE